MNPQRQRTVQLTVNGQVYQRQVPTRQLLADFLRQELHLTGTHVGCEHGVCGACTVLLNGEPVRSCLLLAVQAQGASLATVEGLAAADGSLHPLQQAFQQCHALQCGFCTPGFLMTLQVFLQENPAPTADQVRQAIAGHLCRCTGYQHIVEATLRAAAQLRGEPA
jgi:aerobic carbon-monoxide dehydrogenase small subunit